MIMISVYLLGCLVVGMSMYRPRTSAMTGMSAYELHGVLPGSGFDADAFDSGFGE